MLRTPRLLAATLAGSALFFAFLGAFSYIDFRLERPPFSLAPSVTALVFLVWVMGAAGPLAGRSADRRGWRVVALGGLGLAAAGVALSLVDVLAARDRRARADHARQLLRRDRARSSASPGRRSRTAASPARSTSARTTSPARSASYLPGLAFERWEWPGVVALALAVYAVGAAAVIWLGRRHG